jgi:L-ascorbate metabolism protein UlaG (beta-lactamase superfamily)
MRGARLKINYIGGPTALLEIAGLRLLTDPTFDPARREYPTSLYTLRKLTSPAISVESLGVIDAVLLSHDHHFDNLDHAGPDVLKNAGVVLTTEAVKAARAFPEAVIIPLHYEGWAHFSESRGQVEDAFCAAGLSHRLRWLEPGRPPC